MPSRNVLKLDMADSYYHVYARGSSKQAIFLDNADFIFFIDLFRRYLSPEPMVNSAGVAYEKLHDGVDVLAYCLMGNHFHMLLYQKKEGGMQRLMRGVMTSYSRYFNFKYTRSGQLFESRYKASRIGNQAYLEHISRYIHLNPKDWRMYPYSSIHEYLGDERSDWLQPQYILDLFDSRNDYAEFVADYEAAKAELDNLKQYLADDGDA